MSAIQLVLLTLVGYFSLGLGVMFVINSCMVYGIRQDPEAIARLVAGVLASFPPDLKKEHAEASLADRQAVLRDIEDHVRQSLDHAWFSPRDLLKVWLWPYYLVEFTIGFIQG